MFFSKNMNIDNLNFLLVLLCRCDVSDLNIKNVLKRLGMKECPQIDDLKKRICSMRESQRLSATYFDFSAAEAFVSSKILADKSMENYPQIYKDLRVIGVADREMIRFLEEAEGLPITGDFLKYSQATGVHFVDITRIGSALEKLGLARNWDKIFQLIRSPVFPECHVVDAYSWLNKAHQNGDISTERFFDSVAVHPTSNLRKSIIFSILSSFNMSLFQSFINKKLLSQRNIIAAIDKFIGCLAHKMDEGKFDKMSQCLDIFMSKFEKIYDQKSIVNLLICLNRMSPQNKSQEDILMKCMNGLIQKYKIILESDANSVIAIIRNNLFLFNLQKAGIFTPNKIFYDVCIRYKNLKGLKIFPFSTSSLSSDEKNMIIYSLSTLPMSDRAKIGY